MAQKRTRYTPQVKDQVKKRYRYCRTTADKEALAEELGILDDSGKPSVSKLYNLASRLGCAGSDDSSAWGTVTSDPEDRQIIKERPGETKFTKQDDAYLRKSFGTLPIEDIAYHIGHSEPATLYRSRELGLRLPVKYWRTNKVALWLGMSEEDVHCALELDVHPLCDRDGDVQLHLVSTSSLGRWLSLKKTEKFLKDRDPDEFFILEIKETLSELADRKTRFESCKFLSHGHVCMNPFTDLSFGLFCTNNERYKAGEDPVCTVRTFAIEDLRPE